MCKMFGSIFVLLLILYIVIYVVLKRTIYNYWKSKNVPFVEPNIFFGNLWDVISLRLPWGNFIHHMHETYHEDRYIGIFNMFQPALIIRDLEIIKDILIKDFGHFQNNWYEADPNVDPIIALNPLVLKDSKWKDARSLMTPQFTTAKIKSMFPSLHRVCRNLTQYLHDEANLKKSTCFELVQLSARFTGDAVMSCAFGLDGRSFSKTTPETFIIDGSSSGTPSKLTTLKRTLGLLFVFVSRIFKVTFYGDPINSLFSDIITKAVNDRKRTNLVRNDYLNYLMELTNSRKIADAELVPYAFSFFLDGYETSYVVLSYAIFELSLNTNVQETARNEVEMVLQNHNGEISFDAYKELSYLENVVLESIRRNSAVKVMSKVCTEPYVIQDLEKDKNITIEKGTPVYWSLGAIHHNPKYYPEPDKFDPGRFTEEGRKTRPKYSFLGFSDGPRICVGRRFALAQIVLALAAILVDFDLRFNNKTTLPIKHDSFHISDVPVSGLYVDFIPRNTNLLHTK